jgi:hypothetical protein
MASASVGFAFTDGRGQWGAPRRLDLLLESDKEAFDPDHQTTAPVKHGTANVTLPMQLNFHPAEPTCKTITTPGIAQYPSLAPTPAQKARAEADAAARSTSETFCEQLGYKLNVEAYPDTKELSFNQYCDSCDKKADASVTPDERAAAQQRSDIANSLISAMERSSGIGGVIWSNVRKGADAGLEKQAREREAALAPPMRVNWSDMQEYVYLAYRQDSRMKPVNHHVIVQGTIQSVTARSSANQIYDVYFKDDPKHLFAFCTARPDIFQDAFGSDFTSKMPGKIVEVEGFITKGCRNVDTGIQITLVRQMKALAPGQPGAAVHVWSAAENPIPATPAPSAAPTPAAAGAAPVSRGITRGDVVQNRTRAAAPAQTAAPPQTAPAPQPSAATPPPQIAAATPTAQPVPNRPPASSPAQPTGQPTDQMVESVIRLLKAKTPEPIILEMVLSQRTPHQLSGADRARLEDAGASEKLIEVLLNPSSTSASTNPAAAQSQRYAACQAQANRQFPNDNVARTRAFTACVQAK